MPWLYSADPRSTALQRVDSRLSILVLRFSGQRQCGGSCVSARHESSRIGRLLAATCQTTARASRPTVDSRRRTQFVPKRKSERQLRPHADDAARPEVGESQVRQALPRPDYRSRDVHRQSGSSARTTAQTQPYWRALAPTTDTLTVAADDQHTRRQHVGDHLNRRVDGEGPL